MSQKRRARKGATGHRAHRSRVPMRQPLSTSLRPMCEESLKTLVDCRRFLGMSGSEIGASIARILHRPAPLSRQYVGKRKSQTRVPDDVLRAYGQMIADALTMRCDRDIAVSVGQSSPLHIVAYLQCGHCQHWQAVDSRRRSRCSRCGHRL